MKKDFLLELMKHDELASALKKDVMGQMARDSARKKLRDERAAIRERQYAYEQKTSKAIQKIDSKISNINAEESNLCYIVDQYGDEMDLGGTPHFTRESIELLTAFMEEYKGNE